MGSFKEAIGYDTNITVQFSEFDDDYACQCGGDFAINTKGVTLSLEYNAFINVTARVMFGQSSVTAEYNYVEGMGTGTNGHGEIAGFGTLSPITYIDAWNTY